MDLNALERARASGFAALIYEEEAVGFMTPPPFSLSSYPAEALRIIPK